MLYKPPVILAELASYTRLLPGDIVMTGTPSGVGEITSGACYEAAISLEGRQLASARWIAR